MLGACGRDVLNANGYWFYWFSPKKISSLSSEHFLLHFQKWRFLHLPKRRLVLCVNVRRPPLEAPESDHNLVYVKVRIPRRSAPNRSRESTKETLTTTHLRRLMTDSNLRCQVANAIIAALPPTNPRWHLHHQ